LENETQSLKQEKQDLETQLVTVKESLLGEKQRNLDLEDHIKRLESDIEEARIDFEGEERALKAKVSNKKYTLSNAWTIFKHYVAQFD
jgi:predicted  nucleic acid-binding Zn-ribbon protein